MIDKNSDIRGASWTVGSDPLEVGCYPAGSRVIFRSMRFDDPANGAIVPDLDGYLPHFAYRPTYARLAPHDASRAPAGSAFGNGDTSGVVRMNFGAIYLPFAGTVRIEGGAVPLGKSGKVIVQWLIDRAWGQSQAHINQAWVGRRTVAYYNVPDSGLIDRPEYAVSIVSPPGRQFSLGYPGGGVSVVVPATNNGLSVPWGSFTRLTNGPTAQPYIVMELEF